MSEPLFEPGNSGFGTFDGVSIRLVRTRNHHNRNPEPARGFDLGVGRALGELVGNDGRAYPVQTLWSDKSLDGVGYCSQGF